MFGRRWFSVDYKSFELKEEGEGRKAQVIIIERRGGREFLDPLWKGRDKYII